MPGLIRVSEWSLCGSSVLVGDVAETYELWQMGAGSSLPRDEKHVTESIRPERKLCELCIITKEGKVGHVRSLLCLWR